MYSPTRQNADRVALGGVGSSDRVISNFGNDPADFPAGTVVQNDGGDLSVSTGQYVGVSLGESLSDTKKTAVLRAGNRVPVLLDDEGESGFGSLTVAELTFAAKALTPNVGDITVALVDDGTAGDETVDVDGNDIIVHMEEDVSGSTAQNIKDAIEASEAASALISVAISEGDEAEQQAAFAETNLDGVTESFSYVEIGAPVEVDGGKAIASGDASGAVYVDSVKIGVKADGSLVPVAIIDMGGGL